MIASGPSLTQEDVEYCRGRAKVLAINSSYKMAPWADAVFAADLFWWHEHHASTFDIPIRATTHVTASRLYNLRYYRLAGDGELIPKRGYLSDGRNSGHMGIDLAYKMGAERIILLGFDYQHTGGRRHWHEDHPRGWRNADGVEDWLTRLPPLIDGLRRRGVEIINCSRETAISCIPRRELSTSL